jgi:hypothetical protein
MCLHAICCHIHEFCCNGLQGVTWRYMALHGVTYFLGCHVEILLSAVVTSSWHIFKGVRSVSWTRNVSVAKELSNKMFMSAHVNDIRLQPLYTWQPYPKIWMLHALTRYTKFAVIYKKTNHMMSIMQGNQCAITQPWKQKVVTQPSNKNIAQSLNICHQGRVFVFAIPIYRVVFEIPIWGFDWLKK